MAEPVIKADSGKLNFSAILAFEPQVLAHVAGVREFGLQKYPDRTEGLVGRRRYMGAIMRHLWAEIRNPGSVDEESGYPHLAHVAVSVMLAMQCEPSS